MRSLPAAQILVSVFTVFFCFSSTLAEGIEFDCKQVSQAKPTEISRGKVYEGVPFGIGEKVKYELRYFGTLVGYGFFEVKKPIKYDGVWHRLFHAEAKTGDWYKLIFVAHDKLNAISRPDNYGIRRFYMEQDEGKLFSKRLQQKKWLDFNHETCTVTEKLEIAGKDPKEKTFEFMPGGIDTLGALYRMRSIDFKIGKTEKMPVYSSEKNWWLEMTPEKLEEITTPAGKYQTMKVKLKSYLGKDLQQQGDLFAWVDQSSPHRPLVKIEGDIKLGRVILNMVEFKPRS